MRRILLIPILLLPAGAYAQELPCARQAVPFVTVSHDRESTLALEARRVVSVTGAAFTYNLGKETITVTADSFASSRFLKDVSAGRCSAQETVRLVPERKSPFNSRFKASRPH
ncbi:MAG: hypothetical protein ACYC5N_11425 [Endomicrobiales bacterium]